MWFKKRKGHRMLDKHMFLIVRYSLVSTDKGIWNIGLEKSFEDYCQELFHESRLKLHEVLFRTVTLPSIASLVDNISTKFTLLVLTSELLPENYLKNLSEVLRPYSWARLHVLSPQKRSIDMITECLQEELEKYDRRLCYSTTRLDDDDALAPYFLKELERYLEPTFQGFCFSFAKGYVGSYGNNGFEAFYEHYVPKVSMGLSHIDIYDPQIRTVNHIYAVGDHMKVDQKTPTVLDSTKPMYLRTLHEANDSYNKLGPNFKKVSETNDIKRLFSID